MREPRETTSYIKIKVTTTDAVDEKLRICCIKRIIVLYLFILLTSVAGIYALAKLGDKIVDNSIQLTNNEFKALVLSIAKDIDEADHVIKEDPGGSYVVDVELLDDKKRVFWSKTAEEDKSSRDAAAVKDEEYPWHNRNSVNRMVRSVNRKDKKYVVAYETRFVNCGRFKPVHQGRYLVSPSLNALHACYRHGVYRSELERDIVRNENGILRYNLEDLFVPCEEAFNDRLYEMTDELRGDYAKCRWYGGLSEERQRLIENRFANKLATDEAQPIMLQSTPVPATSLDPQTYVECSHVETELFEDYFESPSYEALQRCHEVGVTAEELTRGIAVNPQPNMQRFDLGNLFVSCMDVFSRSIEYITHELRDDYRRCKRVGAITRQVQDAVERKFYETFSNGRSDTTETTSSTTSPRPVTHVTTTEHPTTMTTRSRTAASPGPYAFASCRRVENAAYLICIKIIKVYSTPLLVSSVFAR